MILSIDGNIVSADEVNYWEVGFGKPLDRSSYGYSLSVKKPSLQQAGQLIENRL